MGFVLNTQLNQRAGLLPTNLLGTVPPMVKKTPFSQAVVANTFSPSTGEAEAGCEFESSLVYKASYRTAKAITQRSPALKNKQKKTPFTLSEGEGVGGDFLQFIQASQEYFFSTRGAKMSDSVPGISNSLFQHGSSCYSNRMKKVINQHTFQIHWWKQQVGVIAEWGNHYYRPRSRWITILALDLMEAHGLLSKYIPKGCA